MDVIHSVCGHNLRSSGLCCYYHDESSEKVFFLHFSFNKWSGWTGGGGAVSETLMYLKKKKKHPIFHDMKPLVHELVELPKVTSVLTSLSTSVMFSLQWAIKTTIQTLRLWRRMTHRSSQSRWASVCLRRVQKRMSTWRR